ncbi:MAG: NAD(P)-dependent oxidoreductase [Caldilineaceae bacterium]
MSTESKASNPKRVLVTGSTGAIGEPVCQHLLSRGHYVRGFARRPSPGLTDFVMGDLNEKEKVYQAAEGMDVIIHLGAYPNPADFIDVLLQPNVVGTYYICEAAKDLGVKRVVLASTLQTVTGHGYPGRAVTVEDGPMPVNHYALTKVWNEQMGDMYARVHNLSVISARIGWLPRNREEAARLAAFERGPDVFLSHEDAKLFHERCVESENPPPGKSVILFVTSRPSKLSRLDIETARTVIGYEPKDVWPQGLPYSVEGIV